MLFLEAGAQTSGVALGGFEFGVFCPPSVEDGTFRFRPTALGRRFGTVATWVQSWVQLEGLFQPKMVRKLRQINESLIGYEPEGREFESLRAHHSLLPCLSPTSRKKRKSWGTRQPPAISQRGRPFFVAHLFAALPTRPAMGLPGRKGLDI